MSRIFGIILIVAALWFASEVYDKGVDEAFGEIFSGQEDDADSAEFEDDDEFADADDADDDDEDTDDADDDEWAGERAADAVRHALGASQDRVDEQVDDEQVDDE